ncbi:MAG: hypothetical protein HW383_845 [Candidatus Magasanikbacteria bacterium]|nr:hypothetical protein [Candidatus Magasanikbacteria bacterium]
MRQHRGVAQLARAPALGAGSRRFKSCHPDQQRHCNQSNGMKFLKETNWNEVFSGWREREADDPGWKKVATQVKGWRDWESWRKNTASQLGAEKRKWQIFELTDPLNEIPAMLVGPYAGWQSRLPKKNEMTFEDLANIPEQRKFFKNHSRVASMMKNFPSPTEMIGLVRQDNEKIICVEGHHRATAVAIAKKENQMINFHVPVRIALAKISASELSLLDKMLERGSAAP